MSAQSLPYVKEKIFELLALKHNNEAAQIANVLCEEYPDDSECYFLYGAALLNDKQYNKARTILEPAAQKFPQDWKLNLLLGNTYGFLQKWSDAEKEYRTAIGKAQKTLKEDLADLYCSVAEALWAQSKRYDALDEWRHALKIYPKCKEAKQSLKECTNVYGEPKANTPIFDDLFHFHDIQTSRYYALIQRDEFISEKEASDVLAIIQEGWNKHIAPQSKIIDSMKAADRSAFFKSITLNFTDVVVKWKNKTS